MKTSLKPVEDKPPDTASLHPHEHSHEHGHELEHEHCHAHGKEHFLLDLPEPGPTPKAEDKQTWAAVKPLIPEEVLALEEKKIAITGFMLPTILDKSLATEFL